LYSKSTYPPDTSGSCSGTWHRYVGQNYASSAYYADREYTVFNTSGIPDNATITGVSLQMKLYTNGTNTDFTIRARYYDWTSGGLGCDDWRSNPGSDTLLGTFNTSSLPPEGSDFTMSLNNDSIYSWVSKTGGTPFYLTSDREENNAAPSGWEWVLHDEPTSPVLVIDYTIPPLPTVDIKANGFGGTATVDYNTPVTLAWTSTDATSCTASGDWSGSKNPSGGSESMGSLASNKTYTLDCTGAGGSKSDSVTVNVRPFADIKADGSDGPITIAYNTAATISWSSANATSCSVTPGGWTGLSNTGISTGNLTATNTYTLNCTGAGGSVSDSVIVNVARKIGDFNGDGFVNMIDFGMLARNWGLDYPPCDVNGDHIVNMIDFGALARNWTG